MTDAKDIYARLDPLLDKAEEVGDSILELYALLDKCDEFDASQLVLASTSVELAIQHLVNLRCSLPAIPDE